MKNITLNELHTLAAAVANAEQGSKAWDKATDALNAKFSSQCLVAIIDQLKATRRECHEALTEIAQRNTAVPVAFTDAQELLFPHSVADMWPKKLGFGQDIPLYTVAPATVNHPVIPDGWKLVPCEPTMAMKIASNKAAETGGDRYGAMLAAAPAPGGSGG